MYNNRTTKNSMPVQDPSKRINNFKEVSIGYTEEMAIDEANRCLNCKVPNCVNGCPVNVKIPEFINEIKNGNFESAAVIIKNTNSLPAICGRVCPQETQCEAQCIRAKNGEPVAIGRLERFVADYTLNNEIKYKINNNNIKVAIIGSGPSGLSCAIDLKKLGYDVTIFEALHTAGGVLVYGIPEFRLPKKLVQKEIDNAIKLGVKIETNVVVGKSITIDELFNDGYKAIYIGTGAGLPNFQGVPGENLLGVYSANEFLTRINLMKAYQYPDYATPIRIGNNVAILGGGNVAMDAARSALRLGAKNVYVIYRRSQKEMPARIEEIEHAKEEGVIFKLLTNTVQIHGDENNRVNGIEVVDMILGEPDESGRRSPIPVLNSNHIIEVDSVVVAIGNMPNPLIKETTPGLATSKKGGIIIDDRCMTNRENIFAGGDAVTGAATVILAMGAGKKAAQEIDKKIKKEL